MESSINGIEIVRAARADIDVPFLHQGRTTSGVDCVGVAICAGLDAGVLPQDYRFSTYSQTPTPSILKKELDQRLKRICDLEQKQPGDVLVFSMGSIPYQIAIYTDTDTLIYACTTKKSVTESRYGSYWKRRLRLVYRFPEVNDG